MSSLYFTFSKNIQLSFLMSSTRLAHPVYDIILFCLINNIWLSVGIVTFSLRNFIHPPATATYVQICSSTPHPKHSQSEFFFADGTPRFASTQNTDKIIGLYIFIFTCPISRREDDRFRRKWQQHPPIQCDSGTKVNILGCDSIRHCEKKKFTLKCV